ncbi:MAG: DUF421 domain-containing protein, partial [Clostridiales bacterium]|nr:DUF421 domain-containing protein [Clostridiales bacterium]
MITIAVRTIILYAVLILIMRVMGKRQIGQLQPGELVITILISEIAAIPMEDTDIPLMNSVISVLLLASFEILTSALCMKSIKLRSALQGNSLVIIRNGVLDQKQIKRLRYTVDDILEALRQKNIFDIGDVQYAVAETDGAISVLLKPKKRQVTIEDMNLPESNEKLQCVLISDGRIIRSEFKDCGMNEKKLNKLFKDKKIKPEEILLLTSDSEGNTNIIKKDK